MEIVIKGKYKSLQGDRFLFPVAWRTGCSKTLVCVVCLLVCCLVFYGSNSVRGTDQYWYLADVETIMDGEPPVSNTYFPGTLLRGNVSPDKPNYFYHNGPMIYLSAFIGEYIGAYRAWILVNLICHFAVAIAIFLGARLLTTVSTATAVSAFYLITPLALWQTMSMLLEQYFAGLMAIVVVGYFYRQTWFGRLLFGCGIVIGSVSHPIFVAIGMVSAVALVISGLSKSDYLTLVVGLVSMVCVMYLGHIVSNLYPTGFFPTLSIAIASVLPNEPSMLWYFSEQGYSINVKLLYSKVVEAFSRQFFDPLQLPFNIFTNLSMVIWAWLFMVKRNQYRALLVASGIVLLLYLGLISMMQHQVRYQQLVSPVVFILIAVAIDKIPAGRRSVFFTCMFVCAASFGVYLSDVSHRKANRTSDATGLKTVLEFVDADAKVVAFDCKCDQRLSYLLKPRPILNIKSRYLDDSAQLEVISMFEPDYFVSNDAFLEAEFTNLTPIKSLTDPIHGKLYWYRVGSERKGFATRITDVEFFM